MESICDFSLSVRPSIDWMPSNLFMYFFWSSRILQSELVMIASFTMGDEMMSSTSCVTTIASPKYFLTAFVHIFQVFAHARRGKGFPSLLADQHLPHPFQAAQLVDEGFHDDDRNHGEQLGVIFYTVNFKYDEPLVQQVDVLVRVQQEVVATALVILPERGQEVVDVEVLSGSP